MAREMKDSGVPWIGEIPADWDISCLKRYCSLKTGSTPSTANIEWFDGDLDWFTPGDFSGNYYLTNSQRKLTKKAKEDGVSVVIPANTVLIVAIGGTAGKIGVTKNECSCNQQITALLTEKIHYKYLMYWMIANTTFLKDTALYTTLPILNNKTIGEYRFITPTSCAEQVEIADYLDYKCTEVDIVIKKIRSSIEEYKKLKQAIITQAVTKGIRGDRPMKDSRVEGIPLIPVDWDVYRGKYLFYETDERSENGNEELLTVSHITGITPRSEKNVSMFMSESLVGYKVCHVGDIAANTMWMWQGAIGVSNYDGVISPSYNTYRQSIGAYESRYLDYLLRIRPLVVVYSLHSTGITASRLRLYPEKFLSLRFVVPPLGEQKEIADYLDKKFAEIDALIDQKIALLSELETYKKSMIYEYVTGKKGVSFE